VKLNVTVSWANAFAAKKRLIARSRELNFIWIGLRYSNLTKEKQLVSKVEKYYEN